MEATIRNANKLINKSTLAPARDWEFLHSDGCNVWYRNGYQTLCVAFEEEYADLETCAMTIIYHKRKGATLHLNGMKAMWKGYILQGHMEDMQKHVDKDGVESWYFWREGWDSEIIYFYDHTPLSTDERANGETSCQRRIKVWDEDDQKYYEGAFKDGVFITGKRRISAC